MQSSLSWPSSRTSSRSCQPTWPSPSARSCPITAPPGRSPSSCSRGRSIPPARCWCMRLVRRSGRGFFELPVVRRLMAPEAIAVIERDYLRLGVCRPHRRPVPPRHPLRGAALRRHVPDSGVARVPGDRARLRHLVRCHHLDRRHRRRRVRPGAGAPPPDGPHHGARGARAGDRHRALPLCPPPPARGARHHGREGRSRRQGRSRGVPVDLRHAAQLVIEIAYADAGLGPEERARVEHDLRQRWGLGPARHSPCGADADRGGTTPPPRAAPAAGRWSASAGSRSSSRCGSRSFPIARSTRHRRPGS